MEINGETRILGIIGKPIRHTMSPVIHNMISEAQGRNMVYVPFEVENDAAAAVKGAYALGIIGMNVTVPYKTAVTESLLEIEELAERIGAVNTLVRTETGFKGYNTDISGLERELADENVSLEGRHVLLLGAGGAARAAAFLCVKLRAASVTILNRTADKAEAIAKDVCAYAGEACSDMHTVVKAMPLNQYGTLTGSGYIALQSTKLGMYPKTEEAIIEDPEFYKKIEVGIDLIYNPGETKFMRLIKETGGTAYNGLKMLLYQAVSAYELWNDTTVSADIIHAVQDRLFTELHIQEAKRQGKGAYEK